MKKRILSLIMIMPIIVMLLTFGFSRTVQLAIDLAVEYINWEYEEQEAFECTESAWAEGIELSATTYPANATNSKIIWSCESYLELDGSAYNGVAEPIAYVEDGKLYKNREGVVIITASVEKSSIVKSFYAYLVVDDISSTQPKFVLLQGQDTPEISISSFRYFGLYDLVSGSKAKHDEVFTARVFPSRLQNGVTAQLLNNNGYASVTVGEKEDGGFPVVVDFENHSEGNNVILQVSVDGSDVTNTTFFNIVDGVNVYSYDDLMYCTAEDTAEQIVLRRNLESRENLLTHKNSALFGRESGSNVVCETTEMESTYDVRYYEYSGLSDKTKIKVGVTFRKNVYGNGYTINAHELAYPSSVTEKFDKVNGESVKVGEVATPLESDPFKGPLIFVSSLGCTCYGQDNIGFLVKGNDITIDNITLKNCNNVSDLSNLDYVGTVLEVMGDNVTLSNSQVMNGRTVIRTMSNKNFNVESCLLSYAREFILKVGSNKFEYAQDNMTIPAGSAAHAILAPDVSADGTPLIEQVDCTARVANTFFYTCGVFCVGMDTHFAGPLLYKTSHTKYNVLAATSYPSKLTLEGDVRFYDWKSVDGLDSSSLISVDTSAGDGRDFSDLFDISQLIENYSAANPTEKMILVKDGKKYVHGGVAFFGGGRNLSVVEFAGLSDSAKQGFEDVNKPLELGLDDSGLGMTSNILVRAAGYGKFKFYMYSPEYQGITVGSIPNIREINAYFNFN
ncbi:MAG: hypothetical protein IKC36_05745 [Clostridia bacterium]|nr:hypothetical protein [Clostridia bacterium]